jgi:ribose-phosphate pyrophosphokinase
MRRATARAAIRRGCSTSTRPVSTSEGATRVVAYITHPILSGKAVEKISNSALDELVVTDSIALSDAARKCGRIRQLSVAALLGETIRRIRDEESVSSLYVD